MIRPATAGDREALRRLFEDTRRRQVETGARNRLVHINRTNTRGNVLNIVNERSNDVYSILSSRKPMRFRAIGRDRDEDSETLRLVSADEPVVGAGRYTDSELETRPGPDALEKKLLKVAREARTAEEEQGVNILCLALGFLTWLEDRASSIPRQAPLILLPVELVRNQRTSSYDIRIRDDDPVTNLPLQQRLKDDFGIRLPDVESDEGWQPSSYFNQVQTCIANRDRWTIDRDGMQSGFFSFAKLLMFLDLAPTSWPDGSLENHALARGLPFEGFGSEPALFGEGPLVRTSSTPSPIPWAN
ncbi:MAG: DUF4011 domain-containing protein [Acetobacteraceae bacterium]|nr:DUF4011 domain-containing protein [Acetobacteraceae bacterium]